MNNPFQKQTGIVVCTVVAMTLGCQHPSLVKSLYRAPPSPAPLGVVVDEIWRIQEQGAEASEFVIYEHEFEKDPTRLNTDGEDHVKQIAARLLRGEHAPVVIERSLSTPSPDTKYEYPVHPNSELDMKRWSLIVRVLKQLGVSNADEQVVVAPAYAPGVLATEAERAFQRGLSGRGGLGGFGGGFGGGLGGGFGGGIGGGFGAGF